MGTEPSHQGPRGEPHRPEGQAVPPAVDVRSKAMDERFVALGNSLGKALREDPSVQYGWSLAPFDIAIAALNGLSAEVNYVVPPPPQKARDCTHPMIAAALRAHAINPEVLTVSRDENPVLFSHLRFSLRGSQKVSEDQLKQLDSAGVLTISGATYFEYLSALQDAARFFDRNRERFLPDAAEYVATLTGQMMRQGNEPLAALSPLISVVAPHPEGVLLSVMGTPVVQRLASGAKVFIPGAGYNSLRDLPAMAAAPQFKFLLNDNDPFVADVLEHVLAFSPINNVSFIRGEMGAALEKSGPVDAIFISNITAATKPEVARLESAARRHVVIGSPIHICQIEDPMEKDHLPFRAWSETFANERFALFANQALSGQKLGISEKPQRELLKLNGVELAELMHTREARRAPYRHMVLQLQLDPHRN